ncbi:ABC transporter ATP-binding protein [Chroogloeocystis siderophila]|uniref:ABC transporter ATP-binding protein n=1 Tax=Chroogloeocystis siderophila 5.2 s.c.1 TaxID=247279 RepID=A0A1U7HNE1_9CHRO|nr:ABC transporter ATP-binding protein [Chroogloeocystis siderophila]OKH25087.1 ABC transporter ATP-binding protein [Chroogloeocystis siderophila 5.2 s.c.1]
MASITIDNLTKYFQNSCAVDHINLNVADGELIALLGPSGCGKTTTLRMLAGFVFPDEGRIFVGDRIVSSPQKTVPPEKRNMSMIFQSYAIWPHKTVFENVAFGLELRHVGREQLRSRVNRALEIVHLSRFANRYPAELSGGQQQRVALARAIVVEPQILLLDEPLSNLDASLRDEMRNEIRNLHDQLGLTTVYVTHDQGEALVLADRIVVMYEGTIQQVGTPEEIYESPATEFVARFIGRCNVLPGTLLASGQVDVGGVFITAKNNAPGVYPGDAVALSVRPHSIIMDSVYCPTDNPEMNCFSAWVEHHNYYGEFRDYTVRLDNSDIVLSVVTSPHVRHQIGEQMYLAIPAECCRVVPQSATTTQVAEVIATAAAVS